jgi:hypothetical protein
MTPQAHLTTTEACHLFHVSRNKLAAMRREGLIRAVNINPGGERAVWRYANRLELVDVGNLDDELRWQGLKRRWGL